ncbi:MULTISPECIES: radical SAM protein [Geobacter]|uniref:Radical SAM protein n=2 Tax=Geobacter TaxID=28231 RepID=A0A0C1TVH7_9BACT|nr:MULTISPECIES: radical SAM protein [Geobacter]KIE43388.1 radical SAM protein [Geobacter soli]MBE2887782.1 radical SAM protein [Geobacter anodireducens]HMN01778.1 radical SAM protein [Geobacter anodireducens]
MPTYVEPVFRPPSEARSLIFQITIGCSQNHCAFCGMYKTKRFSLKPEAEVLAEIHGIPARYRPVVDRVFLADGDALVYPFDGLATILDRLASVFPNLTRVGSYASPRSLATKSVGELRHLRGKKLRILYFGLESGDDATLDAANKGFAAEEMAREALKAREAGMKLSVTAILGLAGRGRSLDHARATAQWINRVSPEYFSLLTLFHRHNDEFIRTLDLCTRRELLHEARELLAHLAPARTILRSNHVSNFLELAGSYPKDRQRLIAEVDAALARLDKMPGFLDEVPAYGEEYY